MLVLVAKTINWQIFVHSKLNNPIWSKIKVVPQFDMYYKSSKRQKIR